MGISGTTLALVAALALGQAGADINQEERAFQAKVFQQWWGNKIQWRFDALPASGKVAEDRVPYSGHIYPDVQGGTIASLRKYDQAFHKGNPLSVAHERADTSAEEVTTRPVTYYQRFGLFGVAPVTVMETVRGTPHWYGHCNGWTAAAIRHAEPKQSVKRNGVVFSPADIKGLLAEIYMYNQLQMLAGDTVDINPGVLHVVLANWIGRGLHPLGMEMDPGKEKWNYPLYAYESESVKWSQQQVEVGTTVTFAGSTRGEFDESPRLARTLYFHYLLNLDNDGAILGGQYFRDSAQIDMLWAPLSPKPSGKEGNERGNPHVDVAKVLSIWRESVPDSARQNWVVIDPPNRAPVFTVNAAHQAVEGQPWSLQLTARDPDLADRLSFVAPQTLVYSIQGGPDANLFSIDENSGELALKQVPDFENPADAKRDNLLQVTVHVSDGAGGVATRAMRLKITDANDPPRITSPGEFKVTENQTVVGMVTFDDPDKASQQLSLSLAGGADRERFRLNEKPGELAFVHPPDFENPADTDGDNVYELQVRVEDDAGEATVKTLNILVLDANEAPEIVSQPKAQVTENGRTAVRIKATDQDRPQQAITYQIAGGADRDQFRIDPKDGELTFLQSADFEDPKDANRDNVYEVQVQVQDAQGAKASQEMLISVVDANDAPVITTHHESKIAENETSVLTVAWRDQDVPKQNVQFSLSGGADGKKFDLDANSGRLRFRQSPNFETPDDDDKNNVYEVEVRVVDEAGGASSQLLAIRVENSNDPPTLASNKDLKVAERQQQILQLEARDEDGEKDGLRFEIDGGVDQSRFAIDPKSGELSFAEPPNFEAPGDANRDNIYDLTIRVQDAAGGESEHAMRITVTDDNDPPTIDMPDSVLIAENQISVVRLQYHDEDRPRQALQCSIIGGDDGEHFVIDKDTGLLSFKEPPNFEKPTDSNGDNRYQVQIQVADEASGKAVRELEVIVSDVRENPAFTLSPTVLENATSVLRLSAQDEGMSMDGITLKIAGGADAGLFTIDSSTGDLSFKSAPDFEKPKDADTDNTYEVSIEISDREGRSARQRLRVRVMDQKEEKDASSDTSDTQSDDASVTDASKENGEGKRAKKNRRKKPK